MFARRLLVTEHLLVVDGMVVGRLNRTRSHISLTTSILTPHLPYFVTLINGHNADGSGSDTKDNIGNYPGGVGRG